MKNYKLQNSVLSFYGIIEAFEARRKDDESRGLILQFPSIQNAKADLAISLRNEPQILPIWEMSVDAGGIPYVAYQWDNSLTPLEDVNPELRGLWIMRDTARILDSLYRRNVYGEFLGKNAIFVDENNYSVHLAFVGLANIFEEHNAAPWGKGASRDDIHHLAKCFEEEILKAKECSEVVRNCLTKDTKRPRYPELIREMNASPLFHPNYKEEISLVRNPLVITDDNANELIANLNTTNCYISPWTESKYRGKNQRECDFQSKEFIGVFVNREGDEHFFVRKIRPAYKKPTGHILRKRFRLVQKPTRGKTRGHHHLTNLVNQKYDSLKEWQIVPEKEKEYIEETAFKAKYCHVREILGHVKKLAFLLSDREGSDWEKVRALKARQKQLDAVPMKAYKSAKHPSGQNIGIVDDITEGILIVEVEIDKKDFNSHAQGEIVIGGSQGLHFPYCFFWRHGKLLSFASSMEGDVDRLIEQLDDSLKTSSPIPVFLNGEFKSFGNLQKSHTLPEIITRDPDGKSAEIPSNGTLQEDVHQETIPFKRQIEAVDSFGRGDIVNPALCKILATPQEHTPSFIPPLTPKVYVVEKQDTPPDKSQDDSAIPMSGSTLSSNIVESSKIRFFNKQLNESQQEAVWQALQQSPLFLVQGPPGTGKTTVIVEMILQILAKNSRARILVCSQANLAVDNVLERLPKNKRENRHARVRKVRLASDHSLDKTTPAIFPFLLQKRIHSWAADAINRSKMNQEKTNEAGGGTDRQNAINSTLKKWRAFLCDPKSDDFQIRGNADGGWLPLRTAFLKSMNVLGATCVHIAASRYRDIFGDTFDYLIVDEAGKATPAETLIPTLRAKQIILIGDHRQLPPFVTKERDVRDKVSKELEDDGLEDLSKRFGKSLFEELITEDKLSSCQKMLDTQRRMPKQIGDLVSKYFYEGKLKSPDHIEYATEKRLNLPLKNDTSLVFIDTSGGENPHDNDRATRRENPHNADVVVATLHCLKKHFNQLRIEEDIAIIAGYKGQVELLRKRIKRIGFSHLNLTPDNVNTVDAFQGRESSVIIYDTVRSSAEEANIGFLDDPRRLNVALSRAQKLLIIIGNIDYLIRLAKPGKDNPNPEAKHPILGEIAQEIKEQGNVFQSMGEALK